jgi:hypothetical protein
MERSAAAGWLLSLDDDAAEGWLRCVGVGGSAASSSDDEFALASGDDFALALGDDAAFPDAFALARALALAQRLLDVLALGAGGTDTALAKAAVCLAFSSCTSDGPKQCWSFAGMPLFSNDAAELWIRDNAEAAYQFSRASSSSSEIHCCWCHC